MKLWGCRVTYTSSSSLLRETHWLTVLHTWWSSCAFMCVLLLLETRKDGKNRVFFYPHHPLPKTKKLGLDWAPHRGFINCNKWRQNASSCPWWREWICSWDFTEGRLTGSLTGHTALSFPKCRADDIIFLHRNLSGAKKFLQILQILKCSLTAACMWHSWKLF